MKMLKMYGWVVGVSLALALGLFGEAKAAVKIGVLSFSDENRYAEAKRGILERLKELGYTEPKASFLMDVSGANKAKAAELVQKFAAAKLDLIFTLGTSITLPVAREIKDVPLVFSVVYDPVEVGIAQGWQSSGNNTTGTSTMVPMTKVMEALLAFAPVKKLAVLYTRGEKNSELQLKDLQEVQEIYKVKVLPIPLTSKENILQIVPEAARTADALYVTGSNLVSSEISTIVEIATQAKVVTVTHLDDMVEKGVLLGVTSDTYQLGRMAAEKAVKILHGAKPAALPIETLKDLNLVLNMKTVRAGQFQVPPAFMKMVKKKIE
ncbi:MAG: ABC transporter substrate-binding protein [Desulfobulbaceae bacterium]|nr:ABC transporter substrate-binding protein [Desulfobulbaceae bacterium]